MRNFSFLAFVAVTFICWGIYGPVLHIGQAAIGDGPKNLSSLRPFICVGFAYFLVAVVFPLFMLKTKGEKGNWSLGGIIWSFGAGVIGAVGALGIILAFKFHGKPVYVMPLVFGMAPIVNTFVTMALAGTFKQTSTRFYVAIAIVAIGASCVLIFKPHPVKHTSLLSPGVNQPTAELDDTSATPDSEPTQSDESKSTASVEAVTPESPVPVKGWLIGLCIATTALCWGAYGPVLHKGQSKMNGSRMRPFLCVGLAYFAIAVIVPFFLLGQFEEPGRFDLEHLRGILWSLCAGIAGAVGALGIIYAFNFGGKPIYVMPLVFGFAPVVNTLTEITSKNLFDQVTPWFILSLLMVAVGAIMVLIFAPRGPKPKTANEPAIT